MADARDEAVWAEVAERYGRAAALARDGLMLAPSGCCGGSGCCTSGAAEEAFGPGLYALGDLADLPPGAVLASLGCGNPTALAELRAGETVLDLGSGGGIDVILSARRVGPTGRAYGLDMTDEMLALAREHARQAGAANAEFLKGHIEEIPLPDRSVDVILSNCVVNLSPDKDRVLREAFRVLRPGGRLAISDVVVRDGEPDIPLAVRRSVELWSGCIAGALTEGRYRRALLATGFTAAEVQEVRRYTAADLGEPFRLALGRQGVAEPASADAVAGRFMSAFIRARKP
ncbi:MAG TPA: arsenite methyltransferase [Bacillota bacterium]|nr:arsenite methyltransferase [Bacillota bacterium]